MDCDIPDVCTRKAAVATVITDVTDDYYRIGGTVTQGTSRKSQETWPRWLPAPNLRDNELHWTVRRGDETGACGAPVMWAEPGHPTTRRRRCRRCRAAAGLATNG